MTNAIPVFGGKWRNSSIAASNPPADPPIPTMGQLKSVSVFERDVCLLGLDCTDFLGRSFVRETDALLLDARFTGMAFLC
jgi:hypothetical protein